MKEYKPKPGDVILFKEEGKGIFALLKRWLLSSSYSHIAIFYDYTKHGLPLVIESIGRGVLIRSLLTSERRYILILRHENEQIALEAAKRAERLADNPKSWYGYFDIPRYVIPRLIWYKLTGHRCSFGYRHNPHFICSEVIDEAFNYPLSDDLEPPLPQDFLTVKELHPIWQGEYKFISPLE